MITSIRRMNDQLLLAVNAFARDTPVLHQPALIYARFGVVAFAGLLVLGLIHARHAPSRSLAAAGWAGLAPLLALSLNQPVGRLVHEPRPYVTHPGMLRLVSPTSDFSFPSDHAVMAGAVAAALLLVNRRLGTAAVAAAALMAFARVYVGAHYPLDVFAGLMFGGVVAWGGWLLLGKALAAVTGALRVLPGARNPFAARCTPDFTPRTGRRLGRDSS